MAPKSLSQPGSTQKTSGMPHSRGPGAHVPPGGVSSRLRKEKSKLGRSISAIFTPLKAGTPD